MEAEGGDLLPVVFFTLDARLPGPTLVAMIALPATQGSPFSDLCNENGQ
jgi:hypothetical protein